MMIASQQSPALNAGANTSFFGEIRRTSHRLRFVGDRMTNMDR